MIRAPVITIATAMISATTGSSQCHPVARDEAEADEDADRGVGVGAQVRGVALQRRARGLARAPEQPGRDGEVRGAREPDDDDADPEVLELGPVDQRADRGVGDHRAAREDQHPLRRGRRVLELLVAVAVRRVGGLLRAPDREEGDEAREQVDRRVQRLGQDRHRAGEDARDDLERDQRRVGDDRDRRGAAARAGVLRLLRRGGAVYRVPSHSSSSRAAWPRWEIASFSASESAAIVRPGRLVGDEDRVVAEPARPVRLRGERALAAALEEPAPRPRA